MKKFFFIGAAALSLMAGCSEEMQDSATGQQDGLVDVTLEAGTGSDSQEDTRIWTGWKDNVNNVYWKAGDAIGVLAGNNNVNRKFVLTAGENTSSGKFCGQMQTVSDPVNAIVYYPYSAKTISSRIYLPDFSNQEFKGTFDQQGTFSNFGDYSFGYCILGGFTMEGSWPSYGSVRMPNNAAIVRFKIQNSLDEDVSVETINLANAGTDYLFSYPAYYQISDGGIAYYFYRTTAIGTTISEDNKLVVKPSETKYVQMAACANSFSDNTSLVVTVSGSTSSGRDVTYRIPKTVQSSHSFQANCRTTVSVPLTSSTAATYSPSVKVITTSNASYLVAPVFRQDSDYSAADTWWGDGTREKFVSGRKHQYSGAGVREASFNHWGTSDKVTFSSLENIASIDFSNYLTE